MRLLADVPHLQRVLRTVVPLHLLVSFRYQRLHFVGGAAAPSFATVPGGVLASSSQVVRCQDLVDVDKLFVVPVALLVVRR